MRSRPTAKSYDSRRLSSEVAAGAAAEVAAAAAGGCGSVADGGAFGGDGSGAGGGASGADGPTSVTGAFGGAGSAGGAASAAALSWLSSSLLKPAGTVQEVFPVAALDFGRAFGRGAFKRATLLLSNS